MFGPSCSVTISREGRNLSRQLQEAQGGQDTADVKEVRQQLRQLEKAEREKEEEEYGKKQKNAEETEKANEIAEEIERLKQRQRASRLKGVQYEQDEVGAGEKITALYERLSRDDEQIGAGNSIVNPKAMFAIAAGSKKHSYSPPRFV